MYSSIVDGSNCLSIGQSESEVVWNISSELEEGQRVPHMSFVFHLVQRCFSRMYIAFSLQCVYLVEVEISSELMAGDEVELSVSRGMSMFMSLFIAF